jgi:UDP-N-acetylmuramoyl-tripeptide--D-alanyl-D-alanine ligase
MNLPLARIAEFVQGTGEFDGHLVASGYSIDSRTVTPGQMFFAVAGERVDGHEFVEAALQAGAVAAVVRKDMLARYSVKTGLIAVDDTLMALQVLAAAVRRLWGKTVVGVTGSTGKTTTKDAIAHVLSSRLKVLKSAGNLNNHFGLPLQLLRLEREHEIAVIEMGMSHAGEIRALASLAQPDIGVVTNVAPVHLEFFDSLASIARAKYELIAALPPGGTAILNADDEYVSQFGRDFNGKVVTYGIRKPADVRGENIQLRGLLGSSFGVVANGHKAHASIALVGEHNVLNSLAAIAVALERGLPLETAVESLSTLAAGEKRGEILRLGGAIVINDCYNSNPKALKSMIDALVSVPAARHVVVAGEMLELGPAGESLHGECGRFMALKGVKRLIGVRGLAEAMVSAATAEGVDAVFVATPEEAGERIAAELREGDAVLMKASRGVRLERALEILKSRKDALADASSVSAVDPGR